MNHSNIIKNMEQLSPWKFVLIWIWLMWLPTLPTAAALWLMLR